MFIRLKESFEAGVERLRWFASILSERIKVELAVIKLLWSSSDLEKRREELLKQMGKRVFELRGAGEVNLAEDVKISRPLKELEAVEAELEGLRRQVSEIGEVEQ